KAWLHRDTACAPLELQPNREQFPPLPISPGRHCPSRSKQTTRIYISDPSCLLIDINFPPQVQHQEIPKLVSIIIPSGEMRVHQVLDEVRPEQALPFDFFRCEDGTHVALEMPNQPFVDRHDEPFLWPINQFCGQQIAYRIF